MISLRAVEFILRLRRNTEKSNALYSKSMKRCLTVFLVLFYSLATLSPLIAADQDLNGLSLGLNYTGLGVRYIRHTIGLEMRYQFIGDSGSDESASSLGLRLNKYGSLPGRFFWYTGVESAYIHYQYKATDLSTDGWLAGAYVGLELLLGSQFSWNIDMGPYFGQTFHRTRDAVDVVDVAMNSSLNYRFGPSR